MQLQERAKLYAERDVIDARIKGIKNRLEKAVPGYGRALEKRSLAQLIKLHEQRAIVQEKLSQFLVKEVASNEL